MKRSVFALNLLTFHLYFPSKPDKKCVTNYNFIYVAIWLECEQEWTVEETKYKKLTDADKVCTAFLLFGKTISSFEKDSTLKSSQPDKDGIPK